MPEPDNNKREPSPISLSDGRYSLNEIVGRGGHAFVWLARDNKLNRDVLIKYPRQDGKDPKGEVEEFIREAKQLGQLLHPYIVHVFDVCESEPPYDNYSPFEKIPYMVMQFRNLGEMTPLDKKIESNDFLTLREASIYLSQIAEALDYAHLRGIAHRDIKPGNIIVDKQIYQNQEQLCATLTDWGLAAIPSQEITDTKVVGTPHYLAPELLATKTAGDARSDVYALAVTFIEAMYGQWIFKLAGHEYNYFDIARKHMKEAPRLSEVVSDPKLIPVFEKALAKNPDDRYQSAGEFAQAFREVLVL